MNSQQPFQAVRSYIPPRSPFDPCPPIGRKFYSTPPHLFLGVQPPDLPQFSPAEALRKGTLWKVFADYYENPYRKGGKPRHG